MNDPIESLLREHDPAAGKALTAFDRTRILSASRATRSPYRRWLVSVTVAALVTFLAALAVFRRADPLPPRAAARQIQYATPGGTRIVWTLDPNFHM